ncbi:MAG: DMT family transporter [Nitrospirota bacterium]|nr:DMT family transporter [Nitrospirota bacterium]
MKVSTGLSQYSQRLGYLYILLAIFLWSSLGIVVRLSGVEIYLLIFYSLLVSIIAQGAILLKKKNQAAGMDLKKLSYPVILGSFLLLNNFSFYYAFQNTTIANAVLTHYTAPIIVAFLAAVFLGEKITGKLLFAIATASAGLWILLDGFSPDRAHGYGIAAGLVSGVAYAVIIVLSRIYARHFTPLFLSFCNNICMMVLLLPFIRVLPLQAWESFFVMGILHYTLAPVLYFKGLQTVTANRAAVLGYLEPVSAIVFSMVFLKEIPGIYSIYGGILILFSGYITVRGDS